MFDVDLIGAPAFVVTVADGGFVYAGFNRALEALTGLRGADLLGRRPEDCLPPAVAAEALARYRRCVEARHAVETESLFQMGGERWFHVTVTPVFGADGAVSSLVGISTDITARKAAERARREGEARMALAIDALEGGFWHIDLATGAFEVTPKLATLVAGRAAAGLTWEGYTAAIHPDDQAAIDVGPLVRGERDAGVVEYRVPDARCGMRWFRSRRRLVRSAEGAPERVVGVVVDVTEQRRLQDSFERQAWTDPLTGLANRRGFEGAAGRLLRRAGGGGRRFGLIVLDLDRFKPINDRHGHAAGDAVLCALADRLRALVRPGDVVARLGGDEFGVLVEDVEGGALPRLAQRLVLAAQAPVDTPAGPLTVGVSLGITASVERDADIADLANRADRALYEAKSSGRGAWRMAA